MHAVTADGSSSLLYVQCQNVFTNITEYYCIVLSIAERLCSDLIAKSRDINRLLYYSAKMICT